MGEEKKKKVTSSASRKRRGFNNQLEIMWAENKQGAGIIQQKKRFDQIGSEVQWIKLDWSLQQ